LFEAGWAWADFSFNRLLKVAVVGFIADEDLQLGRGLKVSKVAA
jgi:hypothetical protein